MNNISEQMIYRFLGDSGLKVSVISYGNMVNYRQKTKDEDKQIIQKCLQNGINYFDTAEAYAKGQAEERLGQILKELNVSRQSIMIGTKIWVSPDEDKNSKKTLNRKHIHESMNKSLQRLQVQYVDIVFAHAFESNTPLQEICRSFHEIVEQGKALYWATSNWDAEIVYEALMICGKYNLNKPICAQNEYHMLKREQNEYEYESLLTKYNYGLMGWSSLAGGFLTGKYLNGIDKSKLTRLTDNYITPKEELLKVYYQPYANEQTKVKLQQIEKIAQQELNCSLAQLALAWCIKYKYLSTAIIGVRNLHQLEENLKAIEITKKIDSNIEERVNKILSNRSKFNIKFAQKHHTPSLIRPFVSD